MPGEVRTGIIVREAIAIAEPALWWECLVRPISRNQIAEIWGNGLICPVAPWPRDHYDR